MSSSNAELRIYDRRSDMPGVVVSLAQLLQVLQATHPSVLSGRWRIAQGVQGYGAHVMGWDRALKEEGPLELSAEELMSVLLTGEEYIDHGTLEKLDDEGTALGVFDSAYVFFRGARQVAEEVASSFEQTEISST